MAGQVALVTGAGRGIGKAIAAALAQAGAQVVVNNVSPERNAAVVAELVAGGGGAVGQVGDVSDPAIAEACVKLAMSTWGRLDIVVNNAGVTRDGLIARLSDQQWQEVLQVNLTGAFNVLRAATRPMMKQRRGRIINISSVVGRLGNAGQANYAASKAGLLGLTKAAARELAGRNITVNAIAPGFIDEGMTESLGEDLRGVLRNQIPLGRFGTSADVAAAVLFLAGPAGGYLTGQTLSVDGGMTMV
ncbi:MAG: 3-oxoacyl-[acyl-carrier-protein] reductase [Fimbriimonadaceae bacterium]|nr:3-oxoacyl-[acyl-carrier-protein] reductase [Fimbriimonadaceae bacterium]